MKELSDFEVCKRVAEIEGVNFKLSCDEFSLIAKSEFFWLEYNPIEDDELCFQLMLKYKIDWLNRTSLKTGAAKIGDILVPHESPNKAICLAIIESMWQTNENQN